MFFSLIVEGCYLSKNFKSLKECSFDFFENLNVITGNNGSGKTTLLESIAYATGSRLSQNIETRPARDTEFDVKVLSNEDVSDDFDVVLLDNFGCDIPQSELTSYVNAIKDKYSGKQIIVASLQPEIVNMADNVVHLI